MTGAPGDAAVDPAVDTGVDAHGTGDGPPGGGRSAWFWPLAAVGAATVAVGVNGVLDDARLTEPAELARWVLGGLLVHDLVVVPLAFAVALAAARLVPAVVRPVVHGGLVVAVSLTIVAWPFLRGYGLRPSNPSALPRDYAEGLLLALAAVAAVTALLALRATRR